MIKLALTVPAIVSLLFSACAHKPFERAVEEVEDPRSIALIKVSSKDFIEELRDDLDFERLPEALAASTRVLESRTTDYLVFGHRQISAQEYADALSDLAYFLKTTSDHFEKLRYIAENFDFYAVYGVGDVSEIFMTSYYAPVIEGSLRRTKRFSQPLYKKPTDLLDIDLRLFDESIEPTRRHRARVENGRVVPYFSRREIDIDHALARKRLEIVWVDPIDSFILQIQGSGTVVLKNGKKLLVNYAEKNGHPYEALGKFLTDHIPLEKMSIQAIEAYLRTLTEEQLHETLALNPSYVFFTVSDQPALTTIGVPAVAGRSIAVDASLFPKGALAFLKGQKPVFVSEDELFPEKFIPFSRFVVDHDTGGAIKGPGRLDLFWGSGKDAARHAGVVRHPGNLFYLAPKETATP